jgi:hypothetical protein
VALPQSAPWLEEFLGELCAFPNGAHDDQVDAFVYCLQRLAGVAGGIRDGQYPTDEYIASMGGGGDSWYDGRDQLADDYPIHEPGRYRLRKPDGNRP